MRIKKAIKIILALFLFWISVYPAFAVEINQVLYDPIKNENGGEAIELFNPDSADIDISGWVIKTGSYERDVVFPENTIIPAKRYLLITDKNWAAKKDNPEWRGADIESSVTLKNKDSGVALKDKDKNTVDVVGWGNAPEGLFKGTPANKVKPGNSLLRINDTGNNSLDFKEVYPVFGGNGFVGIFIEVEEKDKHIKSALIVTDDSKREGIQIKPNPGKDKEIKVKVNATENTSLLFLNKTYPVNSSGGTILMPYYLKPGNYSIKVVSGNLSISLPFEYLGLKAVDVDNRIMIKAAAGGNKAKDIEVKNIGNLDVKVGIKGSDLRTRLNNSISVSHIKYSTNNKDYKEIKKKLSTEKIKIKPGKTKKISLKISTPANTPPGSYSGQVVFVVVE